MIELDNVSKRIKEKIVLDNINIVFHGGNVYGVKGINGSKKDNAHEDNQRIDLPYNGKSVN